MRPDKGDRRASGGEWRRGFFGLFCADGKAIKTNSTRAQSCDVPSQPQPTGAKDPRAASWGIEVSLDPTEFRRFLEQRKGTWGTSAKGGRVLSATGICSVLSRGLRYHSGDLAVCNAVAEASFEFMRGVASSTPSACKPIFECGLAHAMLSCCKVRVPP